MSVARIGWPHSEHRSSTWLIWPQEWCRYSTGGPASPASHLSPQAGPDGFPRVIPIGFHWTGEQIIVCTVPSSPKVRALAARPEVALTIDTDQGTASRSLSVRGVAAIEIVDGVPDEYLAASAKNMDGEQARQFEASVRSMYKQMARITIEPRWARYYDFGAGRLPGFLLKLVQDNQALQG
jgi:Pyridoxamine 5'-phosphate oxidase